MFATELATESQLFASQGGAECPNLPFGLCPRLWNEEHAPDHEEDDVSIYGQWGRVSALDICYF